MHLYPIDGAVHRQEPDATAWGYRDATWSMVIVGVDPDPAKAPALKQWARDYWEAVHPFNLAGAYPNFMMDDEGEARVRAAYGDNYERLAALKKKYDPDQPVPGEPEHPAGGLSRRRTTRRATMPIFMDRHDLRGAREEDVAGAHRKDLEIQGRYGVKYMAYWFDYERGAVFCLVDAPDAAAAERVHREAHGEVANAIIPVDLAAVEAFLGRIGDPRAAPGATAPAIDAGCARSCSPTSSVRPR